MFFKLIKAILFYKIFNIFKVFVIELLILALVWTLKLSLTSNLALKLTGLSLIGLLIILYKKTKAAFTVTERKTPT